jgi:hypothetical protein
MKPFVYLIQGTRARVESYAHLQGPDSDLIGLTYDKPLGDEFDGLERIFLPDSSWCQGRSALYQRARKLERTYEYYIFADDDVEFESGGFDLFQERLLETRPALGVPIFSKTKIFDAIASCRTQTAVISDDQLNGFHRDFLDTSFFDYEALDPLSAITWWMPPKIWAYLLCRYYPGQLHQYNDISVLNNQHSYAAADFEGNASTYVSGHTVFTLELCRLAIEVTTGEYDPHILDLYEGGTYDTPLRRLAARIRARGAPMSAFAELLEALHPFERRLERRRFQRSVANSASTWRPYTPMPAGEAIDIKARVAAAVELVLYSYNDANVREAFKKYLT